MAKPNKRRKIIIFSAIGLILVALTLVAVFRKRAPVITVQTEKVARHSLTNIVVANGQIQPVVQVTISPEVNGEITELPVKEGQQVKKGDLLVKIKPDTYIAAVNQAKANYEAAVAAKTSAAANLEKAEADYKRNLALFNIQLLSESDFVGFKAARDVAKAQLDSADDQVNVAKAQVDNAEEELAKTTILSPLTGTITDLNSEVGERVLGTTYNVGTSIMTVSDLNRIEARVDVGEIDVVGIAPGQKARLQVDAFKDRKFTGVVTAVANSALGSGLSSSLGGGGGGGGQSQQATQFEVRIRVSEKEPAFRPG
ncbi:MAG TPA: efflux RND transporter periplasmic adaptor subunit, partial [Verrucomicrobiae bacterium]|nr:efflux RND transporter periplasmic adaptor subunit [Verrucomicrobiae bacterium]